MNTKKVKKHKRWKGPQYIQGKRWSRDLQLFTSSLIELLHAKVSLTDGIRVAAIDAPTSKLRHVMLAVHEGVCAGEPLSTSFQRLPYFFPKYYVDMVRSGEDSGQLLETMEDIETMLMGQDELRNQISNMTVYLFGIAGVTVFLGYSLINNVFWKLAAIFKESNATLPPLTALVVSLRDPAGWMLNIVVGLFIIGMLITYFRGPYQLRRVVGFVATVIGAPFGFLIVRRHNALAYSTSILSRMTRAQMPLDVAFRTAATLDIPKRISKAYSRVADRIEAGSGLNESLTPEAKSLGAPFLEMANLGESSALVSEAFEELSHFHRSKAHYSARLSLAILEPTGVMIVGVGVFLLYSGLFTPILFLAR